MSLADMLMPMMGMGLGAQQQQPQMGMPGTAQQQGALTPFYDPAQLAQLQTDTMDWQRRNQLANTLMQTGYVPNSGKFGVFAGLASMLGGKLGQMSNDSKLSDIVKRQIEAESQATQAQHQQAMQDLMDKTGIETQGKIAASTGEAKAKRDYAPLQFQAAGAFDPATGTYTPSSEAAQQEVGIAGAKARADAAAHAAYAGAGESAKLGMVRQLMAQPDSPQKTAQLSALLGEGGMQALAFGSMMGGGGGAVGAGGEDFLKTLNPQTAAQVKAIGEYRQAPLTSMAMRSPMGQALMQAVNQAYPEYDATAYPTRSKARSAFTSGKEGQGLNSLNTAIGHAGELLDSADKLGNTSYPLLNTALNAGSVAMGSDKVKNFNLTRDALAGEMIKAFRGAGGSEKDIEEMRANLNAASSPEQLHGAIGQAMKLLGSKAQSLNDQYTQAFGQAAPNFSDPHAKAALQKLVKAGVDLGPLGDAYGLNGDSGATAPAAGGLSDADLLKKYGGG